jgi:hypothetical protein
MERPLLRTLSVALGLLLEVVAKRRGVIFGTDDILARDRDSESGRANWERRKWDG